MSSMPIRLSCVALTAGVIAFALLSSSPARAGDPVYKWKDASGHSQYSQQPPPKGVKFEIVQIAGDTSASGAADANGKNPAGAGAKKSASVNANPPPPSSGKPSNF